MVDVVLRIDATPDFFSKPPQFQNARGGRLTMSVQPSGHLSDQAHLIRLAQGFHFSQNCVV